jgi:hypothetical protein
MYKIEVKRPGPIDKYINYFVASEEGISTAISPPAGIPGRTLRDLETAQRELPPVIFEFINLMERKNLKARFDKVFTRVEFQGSDVFLSTLDLNQTAFNLGKSYFQANKDFSRTNFTLMKDIFFQNMLNEYFQSTAVGSIKTLQFEWYNKRTSINAFKSIMIKQYNKAIAKQPVEARVLPPVKKRKK